MDEKTVYKLMLATLVAGKLPKVGMGTKWEDVVPEAAAVVKAINNYVDPNWESLRPRLPTGATERVSARYVGTGGPAA